MRATIGVVYLSQYLEDLDSSRALCPHTYETNQERSSELKIGSQLVHHVGTKGKAAFH